jgi:hypothetical protein
VGTGLAAKRRLLGPAQFRIVAGTLVGPVLKVPVAPVVTLKAAGPRRVTGVVRPLDPGTTVELQLESERGWWTTAQTTTRAGGAYALTLPEAGRYRARVGPTNGLTQGLSGTIELQ